MKTPCPQSRFTATPVTPKKAKGAKADAYTDPLTDAAKLYADAMKALDQAQLKTDASGLGLTATQTELMRVMSDPQFAQMPDTWKTIITAQAEYVIQAEKVAEEQQRLNELLAATPSEQLEKQRNTMQFLAQAFEQGKISAEQFSEAASAALGNIPAAAEPAKDSFLDLTTVANDAARNMSSAFVDYLFDPMDKSIGGMLSSFLKATAKMIAQAVMLKAVQAGMEASGFNGFIGGLFGGSGASGASGSIGTGAELGFSNLFAKGGAFDGGLQAFASGGVVTRPTPFKFASGGSFKSGLMGEAGPEAILPLQRGSDGKLGVSLNGGGSGGTVVNITVNQTGDAKQESTTGDGGKQLANMIKGAVLDVLVTQKRPGGLLYQ